MKSRKLLLVRHAKSSWDDPSLQDTQRPLSARGRRDTPRMGRRLARHDLHPDLLLTSPARRARQTAILLAEALRYPRADIIVEADLYEGAVGALLRLVRHLDARHRCVLLCGHNPSLLELVRRFEPRIEALPTCAVAELRFRARSWSAIGAAYLVKSKLRRPRHA